MANRFAVADTLGFQLYNDYLQKDIAEKRRKEEQARLERQRKKAKSHGAFGQTLSTLGQVGGAVVGGMTGGVPGAIAGAQLGQAGAGALFNMFPNMGGTEPSGDNPFYDKPSDMQRFGSVFNAGLQAYGQYSQAAKAEAMERVKNDLTAAIQSQGNAFKSMGRSDIQAMLEGLDSYKDAQGLFGESLIDSSTASSIANNVYDMKGQKALKHLEFLMSTKDSEQKSGAIREWLNSYGTAHSDLLPKGGIEAITAGIDQSLEDRQQTMAKNDLSMLSQQNAIALQALQLVRASKELTPEEKQAQKAMEVQVKALSLGTSVDKLKENPAYAELDNVPDKLKPLATAYKNVVELSVATNERALAAKTQTQQQDLAKWHFEQSRQILKDMPAVPENEELRQKLSEMMNASAAKLGITPEGEGGLKTEYSNMNVKPPETDKATDADARGLINQLLYDKQDGGLNEVTVDDVKQGILKYDPKLETPKARRAIELLNGDPDLLVKLKAEADAKPTEEKLGPLDKVGKVLTSTVMNDGSKFDIIPSHVVGSPNAVDNGTAVENYTAQTNTTPAPKISSSDRLKQLMDDEAGQVAQVPREKLETPSTVPSGGLLSDYQQIAAGPNLPEMKGIGSVNLKGPNLPEMKGIGSVNPKGPNLPEMKGIGSMRPPVAVGPNLPEMKGIGSVNPKGPNLPEMKGIGSMRPPVVKQSQLAEVPTSAAKPDALKAAGQGEEVLARVFSDNLTPEETGLVLEKAQQKRPQHLQKYAPVLIALATDSDNETAQMSAAQTIEQLTNEVRQFTSVDVAMNEDRADVLGDLTGQIQVLEDGRRGEVSMAELEQANRPTEQTAMQLPETEPFNDNRPVSGKNRKLPLYMSPSQMPEIADAAAPKGKFDHLLFDEPVIDPNSELANGRTEDQEAAYQANLAQAAPTSELEAEVQQAEAQAETPEEKVKLKLNVLRVLPKRLQDLKNRINDAGGWGILTDDYKDRMSSIMKIVQDTGEKITDLSKKLSNAKDPYDQDLFRRSIQFKLDQTDLLVQKVGDLETEFDEMLVSQGKTPPVPKEVVDEVAEATASTMPDESVHTAEGLLGIYNVQVKDVGLYQEGLQKFTEQLKRTLNQASPEMIPLIEKYIERAQILNDSMTYFGSMNSKPNMGAVHTNIKDMQSYVDYVTAKAQDLIAQYTALRSTFADDIRYYSGKK